MYAELKFSDELLVPELASEDFRLRDEFFSSAAAMISSSLTSASGDVVW